MTPLRPLLHLALNELRGLAVVALWTRCHPAPLVALLTALAGLALLWVLIWREVKPELIARHRARLLADHWAAA